MNQFNPEILPANRGGKPLQLYSTYLPFLIVLLTLIFSTSKDIYFLHKHKNALIVQNAKAAEPLLNAGKEAEFVEKLHTDLNQLAPTDPTAAKILADFFASPTAQKEEATDEAASPSSNSAPPAAPK